MGRQANCGGLECEDQLDVFDLVNMRGSIEYLLG